MKWNTQRRLILEIVRSSTDHPSADAVFMQARSRMPHLSLGTVYRNLKLLAQEGLIQEVHFDQGAARYDGNDQTHAHFICEACGQVEDLPLPIGPQIVKKLEEQRRIRVTRQRLDFYGLCAACQKSQSTRRL